MQTGNKAATQGTLPRWLCLLRSFTNLGNRVFLELWPTGEGGRIAVVGAEGSLLCVSMPMGALLEGAVYKPRRPGAATSPAATLIGLAVSQGHITPHGDQPQMEGRQRKPGPCGLVGRSGMFAGEGPRCSHLGRGRTTRGERLYVFGSSQGLSWSDSHRVHLSWWPLTVWHRE